MSDWRQVPLRTIPKLSENWRLNYQFKITKGENKRDLQVWMKGLVPKDNKSYMHPYHLALGLLTVERQETNVRNVSIE